MTDGSDSRLLGSTSVALDLPLPGAWPRVVWRSLLVFGLLVWAVVALRLRRCRGAAACRVAGACARRILKVGGVRLSVEGSPPPPGVLGVSNHRSYLDILVLLSTVPSSFLCKKEVQKWPFIGAIAEQMGVVFVDRRSPESRLRTLSQVSDRVLSGARVVAFPEGTTSVGPGMLPTYPGLFRSAEQRGFAIAPMAIEYRDRRDAWVDDDTLVRHILFWLSKPHTDVALRFGEVWHRPPEERRTLQESAGAWTRQALSELNSGFDSQRMPCACTPLAPR